MSVRDCVNVIPICEDAKIIYNNEGMSHFTSKGKIYKSVKLLNPQTEKSRLDYNLVDSADPHNNQPWPLWF